MGEQLSTVNCQLQNNHSHRGSVRSSNITPSASVVTARLRSKLKVSAITREAKAGGMAICRRMTLAASPVNPKSGKVLPKIRGTISIFMPKLRPTCGRLSKELILLRRIPINISDKATVLQANLSKPISQIWGMAI